MKKRICICIGIIALIMLCLLGNLLIIGEPVDGRQLAYSASITGSTMELQASATESSVALHSWNLKREGTTLFISARKVLVSPLCPRGDFETTIELEGITEIYLGGCSIWKRK